MGDHENGDGASGGGGEDYYKNQNAETFCTIFVSGLSAKTTKDSIRTHFGQFGKIKKCFVVNTITPKVSYVIFYKSSHVMYVLGKRPHTIDGNQVDTKRATPKFQQAERQDANISTKQLFVDGIKDDMSEVMIMEEFSKFGNVQSIRVIRGKGLCFITFNDYDAVDWCSLIGKFKIADKWLNATKAGKLPDGWTETTPIGNVIHVAGKRFIAFKVPLSERYYSELTEDLWFTPEMLIQNIADRNQTLGLVIDLTNTNSYYKPELLTSHGIKFHKISVKGHDKIPTSNDVNEFITEVESSEDPNHLIGVHCTHGVNRTGYMVCRYMVKGLNKTPDEALESFENGRGYPVKEDYKNELRNPTQTL